MPAPTRTAPPAGGEPLTDAEMDRLEALGWRPSGGGVRRDNGVVYVIAIAPDDTRHEHTRDEWRAMIARAEYAPGLPERPPVPADLPGWTWEVKGLQARLANQAEGYQTEWCDAPAPAIDQARERMAADAALVTDALPPPYRVASVDVSLVVDAPLSDGERSDLARHEETIRRGQQTFIAVGNALADIRDRRLYRETHGSLEAWLSDNYPDIGRRRAYQLIDGAAVAGMVADVNHGAQPTSERSVRPLVGLQPDEARAAYAAAVEAAGGNAPTGPQVEAAAAAYRPAKPAPTTFTDAEIAASIRSLLLNLDCHNAEPLIYGIKDALARRMWMRDIARVAGVAGLVVSEDYEDAAHAARQIDDVELRVALAKRYAEMARAEPAAATDTVEDLIEDLGAIEARITAGIAGDDDRRALEGISSQADALGAFNLGTRAAELREQLGPALPPGWAWRDDIPANPADPRPLYQARRAVDSLFARASHDRAEAARHAAWSEARTPPPPTAPESGAVGPAFDYIAWSRRAAAIGYNLPIRAQNIELIARDRVRGETFAIGDEARLMARIEELEAKAALKPAPAEKPAKRDQHAERNYARLEQILAGILERLSLVERLALAAVCLPDEELDLGGLDDAAETLWEHWTITAAERPAYVAEALKAGSG